MLMSLLWCACPPNYQFLHRGDSWRGPSTPNLGHGNHRLMNPTPHAYLIRSWIFYSIIQFHFIKWRWHPHFSSYKSQCLSPIPLPCPSSELFTLTERQGGREGERYKFEMLGVFSSSIVSPPEELVAAGSRTPSPKITATALVNRFVQNNASAVSLQIGDDVQLAFTHHNQSALQPR